MNDLHQSKFVQVIAPRAILNNDSWTTNEIDTLGYEYATIIFSLGASDIAMTALKVQESDTTGTGFADITGATAAGGTDIDGATAALPSATDDNNVVVFQIDLKARKRFLDLVATIGNGSAGGFGSAVCILSKAAVAPESVSATGAETLIRV